MMLESREQALKQGFAASDSLMISNANVGKVLAVGLCAVKIVLRTEVNVLP